MARDGMMVEPDATRRPGWDPVRALVWMALAVCLAPAALAVLVVGALGLAACEVARLAGRWKAVVPEAPAAGRRDGAEVALGRPHLESVRCQVPRSSRQ